MAQTVTALVVVVLVALSLDALPVEAATTSLPCHAVANCANCSTTNPTQCAVCGNSWYLLDGACVAACPAQGYTATGTGRFNRVCAKNYACTPLHESCLVCNANRSACIACAHSQYLLQGKCVASCPATGYSPRGTGRFNRMCVAQPVQSCQAMKNNCFLCDATNTRCLTCTRGKVLFEGHCIERANCPASTHRVRGTGQFRLRCLPNTITANTTCASASCFACPTNTAVCEDCVPPQVLDGGSCVTSCPSTSIRMPGFGASSVCIAAPTLPATCQPNANGCLSCSQNTCAICDPAFVLFQGACLDACPAGTLVTVTATLGRHCN